MRKLHTPPVIPMTTHPKSKPSPRTLLLTKESKTKDRQTTTQTTTEQRTEQKRTYKWNEDEKGKVFLSPSEFIVRHPKEMRREACKRWFSINKSTYPIELLDIECALCHVTGVKFAILDFLQKLPFSFAQNVLGRAHFALINPPFCGDNFLTDTR